MLSAARIDPWLVSECLFGRVHAADVAVGGAELWSAQIHVRLLLRSHGQEAAPAPAGA